MLPSHRHTPLAAVWARTGVRESGPSPPSVPRWGAGEWCFLLLLLAVSLFTLATCGLVAHSVFLFAFLEGS